MSDTFLDVAISLSKNQHIRHYLARWAIREESEVREFLGSLAHFLMVEEQLSTSQMSQLPETSLVAYGCQFLEAVSTPHKRKLATNGAAYWPTGLYQRKATWEKHKVQIIDTMNEVMKGVWEWARKRFTELEFQHVHEDRIPAPNISHASTSEPAPNKESFDALPTPSDTPDGCTGAVSDDSPLPKRRRISSDVLLTPISMVSEALMAPGKTNPKPFLDKENPVIPGISLYSSKPFECSVNTLNHGGLDRSPMQADKAKDSSQCTDMLRPEPPSPSSSSDERSISDALICSPNRGGLNVIWKWIAPERKAHMSHTFFGIGQTLAADLSPTERAHGYIYAIQAEDSQGRGMIKIGTTDHIRRRMRDHKKCYGEWRQVFPKGYNLPLRVYHASRVERLIHAERKSRSMLLEECPRFRQGHHGSHGEWFDVSEAHALAVIEKWIVWMFDSPYEEQLVTTVQKKNPVQSPTTRRRVLQSPGRQITETISKKIWQLKELDKEDLLRLCWPLQVRERT